jgi:hypothetical protein
MDDISDGMGRERPPRGGPQAGLPAHPAVGGGTVSAPGQEHGRRRSVRGRLLSLSGFVLAGAAAGIVAKIADESTIGWLGDLGTYPAVWVLAVAVIARTTPTAGVAATGAGAFFAAMVGGYYGWASLVLGFPPGPEPLYWITIATLVVPLVAGAVWWAIRSLGAMPGLMLAATASLAVLNGATPRAVLAARGHLPVELVRPVQVVAEAAVIILLLVVLPRHRRTRWWAIGTWLPLAWLTSRMLDQVLGRIGIA